jgi:hypothetical protein
LPRTTHSAGQSEQLIFTAAVARAADPDVECGERGLVEAPARLVIPDDESQVIDQPAAMRCVCVHVASPVVGAWCDRVFATKVQCIVILAAFHCSLAGVPDAGRCRERLK